MSSTEPPSSPEESSSDPISVNSLPNTEIRSSSSNSQDRVYSSPSSEFPTSSSDVIEETPKNNPRYAATTTSGIEGPDQILPSEADGAWDPNGRIRIRLTADNDFHVPISIPGLLNRTAAQFPNHPAIISSPDSNNERTVITYEQYASLVKSVAKSFLRVGLQRHHGVCILGFNSPQWLIANIAAIYAGGIAVGIDESYSTEACQHFASSTQANVFIVDDDAQLQKILPFVKTMKHVQAIIQYQGLPREHGVMTWEHFVNVGEHLPDDHLDNVSKLIGINECCSIMYTSGTVGSCKAVMLNHDNILSNTSSIAKAMDMKAEAKEIMVSYLPLAHIAAQIVDIYLPMMVAGTVYMAEKNSRDNIVRTLRKIRPTFFLGTPTIWENIWERMQTSPQFRFIRNFVANWARARALEHYAVRPAGTARERSWAYVFSKWLIFNKVKLALGLDRCRVATAVAPLSADVKRYFMGWDLLISDAYGLTECAGAHTATPISIAEYNLDNVGKALPGFETKLLAKDEDGVGEICIRGRHVFMGYLHDREQTMEAKDQNSWLRSGDLGKMDTAKYLTIIGRIKDLVITASGEKITATRIEERVKAECSAISNVMLVGNDRPYLAILIAFKTQFDEFGQPTDKLTTEAIRWAESVGSTSTTVTQISHRNDQIIQKALADAIHRANQKAPQESHWVRKFYIIPEDFRIVTGELGPTLKIKRHYIFKKYERLVDEMYKEDA